MDNKGFSLVELMVVIAIIALLCSISVVSYKKYILQAKINSVMPLVENFILAVSEQRMRNNGTYPNTVTWKGLSFPAGSNIAVNIGNLLNMRYDPQTASGIQMFRLMINYTGIAGVPGYVAAATSTSDTTGGMLRFMIYDTNGGTKVTCGQWWSGNAASEDINDKYLPAGCMCGLETIWLTGTGATPC